MLVFFLMIISWAPETMQVVLLDGTTVQAQQVSLERSMVCCQMEQGQKMFLSQGMVDWERMKKVSPDVFLTFFPGQSLEPAPRPVIDRKAIVITNEELKALSPRASSSFVEVGGSDDSTDSSDSARSGPIIDKIGIPGQQVDVKDHMEKGRWVVFDFYADWCGPCRQLTPRLEALARKYPDKVAVKKIDIVKWGTPVTKQYGVNSIPYLQLYDENGRKKRDGNGFEVLQYVEKLSKSW